MAWEILAMWAIVLTTIIWFIRDEKRLRSEAELKRAARYFAHAPQYRHLTVEPAEAPLAAKPLPRTGGLSREQRAFIEAFSTSRA